MGRHGRTRSSALARRSPRWRSAASRRTSRSCAGSSGTRPLAAELSTAFLIDHPPLSTAPLRLPQGPFRGAWRLNLPSPPPVAPPAVGSTSHAAEAATGESMVTAAMPGTVIRVEVAPGDTVAAREPLVVLGGMKMEMPVTCAVCRHGVDRVRRRRRSCDHRCPVGRTHAALARRQSSGSAEADPERAKSPKGPAAGSARREGRRFSIAGAHD